MYTAKIKHNIYVCIKYNTFLISRDEYKKNIYKAIDIFSLKPLS